MKNKNNHNTSPFWFGFALGTLTIGAGAFFFGTKKGRKMLHQMLEYTENLEENLLVLGEEFEEKYGDKLEKLGVHIKGKIGSKASAPISEQKPENSSLGGILEKVKGFRSKQKKQVFVKEK